MLSSLSKTPSTSVPSSLPSSFKSGFSESQSLVEIAPSGVSSWSGPQIEISRGSQDSLTVHLRIPLCSIATPATANPVNFGGGYDAIFVNARQSYGSAGTQHFLESLCLSPTLLPGVSTTLTPPQYAEYLANPDCSLINLIAAAFSKYRMTSDLKLHYLPQTTTVDPSNFALCFTDDPMHPLVGMGAYTVGAGSNAPNFNIAKNSVNSVVFASWSTWSKSFPLDRSTNYFTTTPYGDMTSASAITIDPPFWAADLRFSHFGALNCYASESSTSAAIKGELYMEFSVEFFDFVPVAGAASIPFSLYDWHLFNEMIRAKSLPGFDDEDYGDEKSSTITVSPGTRLLRSLKVPMKKHLGPATTARSGNYGHSMRSIKSRASSSKTLRATSLRGATKRVLPTLQHVVSHLNKHVLRLPKSARPVLRQINELHNKKPKAWQNSVKGLVKSLVKDVPVVGSILSELTESFGGPVLDWISSLF